MSNDDADVLAAAFSEYKETEANNKVVCLEAIAKALDELYRTNDAAYKRLLGNSLVGTSSRPTTLPEPRLRWIAGVGWSSGYGGS